MLKSPYSVIKRRCATEKSKFFESALGKDSPRKVFRASAPKYTFIVELSASKREIALAIEFIFAPKKIKVASVNTLIVPEKVRRVRGKVGVRPAYKKAVVSLSEGDSLD